MNRAEFLNESGSTFRLAWPLVISALVNMSIAITDVVMMGWIDASTLAAGAATSDFYSMVCYLAAGIVAGVTPMMAQARGARRYGDVRRALQQGFWVAGAVALPAAFLVWHADMALAGLGVDAGIVDTAGPYARTMALTLVPMLGVYVWHGFLAVHGRTRAILYVTAVALPLNALGNYALMFGRFGMPELGLAGAGLSSFGVALFMLVALGCYATCARGIRRYRLFARAARPDPHLFAETLRIGVPIGLMNLGNLGVFLFSTVLMGVFGPEALAAHAVAIRTAGVAYAIPLGLSQAATVRVGHAVGAGTPAAAKRAVTVGLVWAGIFGGAGLLALWAGAGAIAGLFLDAASTAPEVFSLAVAFLLLLALGEPMAHLGAVAAGALRGVKDTRIPSFIAIVAYWLVGFSTGAVLAFAFGFDGLGLWIGLAVGLMANGAGMLARLSLVWRGRERVRYRAGYAW